MQSNTKENTDTESSGVRYSIKEKSDGGYFVDVEEDIIENVSEHDLVSALADVVKNKFKDFIDVNGQKIGVNSKTAHEWVWSKSARTLKSQSYISYMDKLRAFNNSDELLKVSTDYVNEAAKHKAYDQFGRGKVYFKVNGNGYEADIVVGITKTNKIAVLYDIVSIQPKKITELLYTTSSTHSVQNRRNSSANNNISQPPRIVKDESKKSLSETDSDVENVNDIYGYKIKQGIKVNEDLLELLSIYDKNAKVDTNGNVTVYHRTNADAAEKIRKTGIMTAKEDALFFSSEDNGYAIDYGDTVITLKIPSTVLEVNDVFDGEVHFDLPLRYKNGVYSLNVSQYIKDTDTKFSLSEPVEEKGNLIAVHNIYTDKLVKSLKLGGFPMPSIAVTKADMGHENYGECSFVFDKSTIDPKADKRNKIYGGDAWTPTYPAIEYKVSEKIADKARRKYYDLYKQYGEKVRDMYRYSVTLEDTLNSDGGEQKMLDKLYDDVSMMQIYRLDHGEDVISNVVKREEKQTLNEQEIALSKQLLSTFGNRIEEIAARNGENPLPIRKAFFNKYHDEVTEAFKKYYRSTGMSIEEAEAKVANTKTFTFVSSLAKALKYKHNKGITVTEDIDYEATDKAIRDSVDRSEYRKWIDGLFKGAEEKSGIWNGKDFYTPSGRTRNFDALHYEETLENVVKVMRSEMNGDTLFA